jgi:TonB-dependent starch-binding outer membrane protein SusC
LSSSTACGSTPDSSILRSAARRRPRRVCDLIPEDIQRIEVLTGPAAALYGDGAANGVIVVTTKSGGGGPLRLSSRATWDASQMRDVFPANYHRLGVSPSTGQPVANCSLIAVSNAQCTPTGLEMWNPLEQASPFRIGNSARGHFELGGAMLGTPLYASVTGDERRGTLPHDEASRLGFHGKLSRAMPGHLTLLATGGYLRDNARLAVVGNTAVQANVIGNGLTGSAENDATHGFATGFGTTPGDSSYPDQRLRHASGGIALQWQPLSWLDAAAGLGRDRVTEHWTQDQLGFATSSFQERTFEQHEMRSSTARISASYHPLRGIAASSGMGLDRDVLQTALLDSVFGNGLVAIGSNEFRTRTTALWIDQRLVLPRQIAIGAALERITSTIFASGAKEWFPAANVAWTPAVRSRGLSDLRLRAAYAEAAGATGPLINFFLSLPVLPSFQRPVAAPKLERTRQLELGADARVVGSVQVDLTAFDSRSTRLFVPILVGPPGTNQSPQGAKMTNIGVEALVGAPIYESSIVRWTGSLSLALLRNRVTHMISAPVIGFHDPVALGQAFGSPLVYTYTYSDANHDGIISANEVQLDQTLKYVGPPLPTLESAFTTGPELPGHVTLSGTLDYRSGNRILDFTAEYRCDALVCRATQDPSAPLAQQAAAVASRLATGVHVSGYMEDAGFMRIREIAAHWTIPAQWAGVVGTRAELTVAGRNLATWTNYRGLDPEISYQEPAILPRQDFLTAPLPREFIVRLDVGARAR